MKLLDFVHRKLMKIKQKLKQLFGEKIGAPNCWDVHILNSKRRIKSKDWMIPNVIYSRQNPTKSHYKEIC